MVNYGLSSGTLLLVLLQLAIIVFLIGTALFILTNPLQERSTLKTVLYIGQISLSFPLFLCIGIYFFQGWRLDPPLVFALITPLIMIGFLAIKDLLLSN